MSASDFEIEREARRVLSRLCNPSLFLAPNAGGGYALAGIKRAGRTLDVSAGVVNAFRKRDWLKPRGTTPETFAISDAGMGWFARDRATHDPFAAQHRLFSRRRAGRSMIAVNEMESPLDRLKARGQISKVQYESGERLRRDFTIGGMMPRLCADLAKPISNGHGGMAPENLTENMIAARQRFRAALANVGPGLADLLLDVCCFLKGLEAVESANEWPMRSAKVVLQIALDRLAVHYGIASQIFVRRRTRTWHADEARAG